MQSLHAKLVVSAVGMAVLIATPAFAKHPGKKHVRADARAAQARVVPAPFYGSFAAAGPIFNLGLEKKRIGTDPDPNVRLDLQRDNWAHEWGGN